MTQDTQQETTEITRPTAPVFKTLQEQHKYFIDAMPTEVKQEIISKIEEQIEKLKQENASEVIIAEQYLHLARTKQSLSL